MKSERASVRGIVSAGALLLVSGCRNDTNTLIGAGENPLSALVSDSVSVTDPAQDPLAAMPSLTGLDRSHWPLLTVAVPRGQVETNANYFESLHLATGVARDTGCYPTYATALEGISTNDSLLIEAIVQPVWVPVMLIAAPIRRYSGEKPFDARYPTSDYELTPRAKN